VGDASARCPVAVVGSRWWAQGSEQAFVLRALAGALSRHTRVHVVAPGPTTPTPDGLFDVLGVGAPCAGEEWPDDPPDPWAGPQHGQRPRAAIVLESDTGACRFVARHLPGVPMLEVGTMDAASAASRLRTSARELALHVPVNPLAAARPHNGFGFTGYVLVLTDRPGSDGDQVQAGRADGTAGTVHTSGPTTHDGRKVPTPLASGLIDRFPEHYVVVVEDAQATAWGDRSCLGSLHVDTRTDLWRLMAHALVTVDLRPGELVARECVESLCFRTPIVVPAGTAASPLADAGGGRCFEDASGLLAAVHALTDPATRAMASRLGHEDARARHADPGRFVANVGTVLAALRDRSRRPAP
jgi:hypothetical protein